MHPANGMVLSSRWIPKQPMKGTRTMLVLSRTENERINIGENITLVVTRIEHGRVKLAIDAPRDVRIVRSEIAHQPPKEPSRN